MEWAWKRKVKLWIQCCRKEMTGKEENRYNINFFKIKGVHGAELAPSVKYILHRHENMSTVFQHPGMVVCLQIQIRVAEAGGSLGFAEQPV